MDKIIITGITGQDGIFLTKKLLERSDQNQIYGVSRGSKNSFISKLKMLGCFDVKNIEFVNLDLLNFNDTYHFLEFIRPSAIYNLSGPSSVYESLYNKNIEIEIVKIFENLTKALIKNKNFCNFFQPSSSEMFEFSKDRKFLNEESPFLPRSPYARAKLKNHNKVIKYSKKYDWNIFSGILFNHESEFRKSEYLFPKIISTAKKISNGLEESLTLGSLDIERDWTFAGDVTDAIFEIVNYGKHPAYVVGSGTSHSIKNIVEIVFTYFGLDYENYIKLDTNLIRKDDPKALKADASLIKNNLGWRPKLNFQNLIFRCIEKSIY